LTQNGTAPELQSQLDWLNAQPHPHKVVIAGNHDIVLDQQKSSEHGFSDHDRASLQWGSITYLERSAFSIRPKGGKRAVSIHGDPRTQRHGNWAFQYEKGSDVFSNQLGTDIDILITHAAPHYHLDVAGWGDVNLLRELWRVKPKLHVFGHIHQGRGSEILVYDQFELLYEQIRAERTGLLGLFYMAFLLLRISFMQDRTSERTILINASCVGGQRDQLCRNAHVVHI
jgi:3',5'-cyclic AMP phosphodiesterase CpdA